MSDKVTLATLTSFTNDTTAVNQTNANNALITTAFDNTLSRDGVLPNSMNAPIDMNSNQILNLPAPAYTTAPLRLEDLVQFVGGQLVFINPNLNGFVTPALYGAVGDGVTDDTAAIQSAFNSSAAIKIPLLITGNFTYAISGVTIPSNLTVLGDGQSGFKLITNAASGFFKFLSPGTTSGVIFDNLLFDGNITNQSGFPHNLINSVFFGGNNTCLINTSRFTRITATNIDGMLFGNSTGTSNIAVATDCVFEDIRVTNWTQILTGWEYVGCNFTRVYGDNSANTNLPPSGQGGAYGVGSRSTDCTYRDIKIIMPTQLQGTIDRVGFNLTSSTNTTGNNVVDNVDIDCSSTAHNFSYTIDTGFGNKLTNLKSRNCVYNTDYEIFNQVNFQGTNLSVIGSGGGDVGIIFDGCNKASLDGFNYQGIAQLSDAIRFDTAVYGPNSDITLSNYVIDTQASGIRFNQQNSQSGFILRNGHIKNLLTTGNNVAFYCDGFFAPSETGITSNVIIDGLIVDTVEEAFVLHNASNWTISNCKFLNLAFGENIQDYTCSNIRFHAIDGLIWARQTHGVSHNTGFSATLGNNQVISYWSFVDHGGAIGTITLDPFIPAGAVIKRITFFPTITPASATNAATVTFGLSGPGGSVNALANTLNAHTGYIAGNPHFGNMDGTVATNYWPLGFSGGANPTINIAGEALTAGFIPFMIDYDIMPG